MTKPYEPKGTARKLIDAIATDPARVWTTTEACEVMGIHVRKLYATLQNSVKYGLIYQAKRGGRLVISGQPFSAAQLIAPVAKYVPRAHVAGGWQTDPNDPRIGKVVQGWTPPRMVCVRLEA
jgi:hypothetical protein